MNHTEWQLKYETWQTKSAALVERYKRLQFIALCKAEDNWRFPFTACTKRLTVRYMRELANLPCP